MTEEEIIEVSIYPPPPPPSLVPPVPPSPSPSPPPFLRFPPIPPQLEISQKPTTKLTPTLQNLDLRSIRTHGWHILPCSAMTGVNLKEGLAWVVQDAKSRLFLY